MLKIKRIAKGGRRFLDVLEEEGGEGTEDWGVLVRDGNGATVGGFRAGFLRVAATSGVRASKTDGSGVLLGLADVGVTVDVALLMLLVPGGAVELVRLGVDVDTTLDEVEGWDLGGVEVTVEVNGTTNRLDLREAEDGLELGVVSDLEATVDLGQLREGDVGELLVGDNGERATELLELRTFDTLDGVVDEAKRGVDVGQVWQVDVGDIAEGDVVGPDELRERCGDLLGVEGDVKRVGNGLDVDIDLLEILVVVDVEGANLLDVDTLKRVETSVRNNHLLAVSDLLLEVEAGERWKGDPVDLANLLELWHLKMVQNGGNVDVKLVGNLLKVRRSQLGQLGGVLDDEGAINLLQPRNGALRNTVALDGDVTLEGRARSKILQVTIRRNLCILVAVNS